jgi:formylmethanofuran dehydrogenase subunit E
MSELFDSIVEMQKTILKATEMEADEKAYEPRNGKCSYCGEEATKEELDENKGLCENCINEEHTNWEGAR